MGNPLSGLSSGLEVLCFWSKSCPSCHANMPELHRIRDAYAEQGVRVVSVHRPMNESDLDEEKVREVARELGITETLLFDNDHKIGDELGVEAWPTYFLFDCDGKQRRRAAGQFGIRMVEQALIRLLDAKDGEKREEKAAPAVTESFPLTY